MGRANNNRMNRKELESEYERSLNIIRMLKKDNDRLRKSIDDYQYMVIDLLKENAWKSSP